MLSSSPWPSPPLGEGRWRDRDNDLTTARRPARESARRLQVRSGGTKQTRSQERLCVSPPRFRCLPRLSEAAEALLTLELERTARSLLVGAVGQPFGQLGQGLVVVVAVPIKNFRM